MLMTIEASVVCWPILKHFPESQLSQIRSFIVIGGREPLLDAVVNINEDRVFGFYHDEDNVKIVELGGGKEIVQMCHGNKRVLALTKQGQVLLWDENLEKQLQNGVTSIECMLPTVVDFGAEVEPISEIKCGMGHNLAITQTGKLYAWGNNGNEQCGFSSQINEFESIPTKVIHLEESVVTKIDCGKSHSMALTVNGLVYSFGYNGSGQLGIGNDNVQSLPFKVIIETEGAFLKVKDIACGDEYSLLLTEQGFIYGCGHNYEGQVGCGSNQLLPIKFVRIDCKEDRFTSIYALNDLSVAMSSSGFCYVWGKLKGGKQSTPLKTNMFSVDHVLGVYFMKNEYSWYNMSSRFIQVANPTPQISYLSKTFNDPTWSDLKFVVQGHSIHVHRQVLQLASVYYRQMLSDTWLQTDSVELDAYPYSVYYACLLHIYSGQFQPIDNLDDSITLLDLATCQLDSDLQDRCIEHLTRLMSLSNCCRLYVAANKYQLAQFKQTILQFIATNLNDLIKSESFQSITPEQSSNLFLDLKHFV